MTELREDQQMYSAIAAYCKYNKAYAKSVWNIINAYKYSNFLE